MPTGGFRYAPGLDGVRALAVLSVFTYHLGVTAGAEHYLSGGFLGVDVFFVLSGYLITTLLLVEFGASGRISIKKFYIRRARRLLPALFALLLIVGAIGVVWLPQQAARLRGDLIASFVYVTNWWLIDQQSSYFGTGERPPLLTHLWSLAVEEQFYLLWPLLLIFAVRGRHGRKMMLVFLGLAIAASTVAAALLFDPWGDPSRVYYGTDTRAATPLIGAALAILVKPWRQRKSANAIGLDLLGFACLVGLGFIAVLLGDRDSALYHGGFLVIALLAGGVVVAAGHPATRFGDLLGRHPLRWLGERSYAIYLWHWPVCVLTRPLIDVPVTGWANSAMRIAITLALAELSYWLVERPVRHGNLFRWHPLAKQTPAALPHAAPGHAALPHAAPPHAAPAHAAPLYASAAHAAAAHADVTVTLPITRAGGQPPEPPVPNWPGRPGGPGGPRRPPSRRTPGARKVSKPSSSRHRLATAAVTLILVVAATAVVGQLGVTADRAVFVMGEGPVDHAPDVNLELVTAPTKGEPRKTPVKVAIFGDSQAKALFANRPADIGKFLTLSDESINACGILRGKVRSRSGEAFDLVKSCPRWQAEWAKDANRVKPEIALVVIGAWDVFDLTTEQGKLVFGTPAWDEAFLTVLGAGIAALRSSGATVALALLPCYRPLRVTGGAGYWPERGDDDRTRHVNDLFRKAVTSGVYTVEPAAEFCTDATIAASRKYRWDGVHYLKTGSALYFNAVVPQLLTLPA